MHGEMLTVELFHFRKKLTPVPMGRCEIDIASEHLRSTADADAAGPSSSRRWHRVMMTRGAGVVSGECDVELLFYAPKDPKGAAARAAETAESRAGSRTGESFCLTLIERLGSGDLSRAGPLSECKVPTLGEILERGTRRARL